MDLAHTFPFPAPEDLSAVDSSWIEVHLTRPIRVTSPSVDTTYAATFRKNGKG